MLDFQGKPWLMIGGNDIPPEFTKLWVHLAILVIFWMAILLFRHIQNHIVDVFVVYRYIPMILY